MSKRKSDRRGLRLAREMRRAMSDREIRKSMARRSVAVLPTMLTLGNGVCGFGAICFASSWTGFDATTNMFVASCLIYLAMVFDALDGSTARRLKQTSEFGGQLDSLCDAISFGAAPAVLMLHFAKSAGYHPRVTFLIGALYVCCTVLRLARYNVESDDTVKDRSFCGLPSPAAAGTVASFPLMVYGLKSLEITAHEFIWEGMPAWIDWGMEICLPPVTLVVAFLMVSRVRFPNTFHYVVRGRRNVGYLIKIIFALAIIFLVPQIAVPMLFGWYTFTTPMRALLRKWTGATVTAVDTGPAVTVVEPEPMPTSPPMTP